MIRKFENGNGLIFSNDNTGEKIIFIAESGPLNYIIIEPNKFTPGSEEWANKEVEDYLTIKKYSERR